MTEFHFDQILLPHGWANDVSVLVGADGCIERIEVEAEQSAGASHHALALPGMANLHSHAFQRGMAGLSERRGPGADSFWSWRQIMYGFNDHLTPDHARALAALVYCEMLESGFTAVGEFHYLHHDRDGTPYDDIGEMAGAVCAAAAETGIGMTLLPVFYRWAGFGDQAPSPGQRRFINDPDRYARLMEAARRHTGALEHGRVGIAPHSLRAASSADIAEILPLAQDGPVHIHIAEQVKEVEECCAALGARPVQHLLDNQPVDARWCLVHATHLDDTEIRRLAESEGVAGLCPLTEANLGDGLFPAVEFLDHYGRIGIGSDSHIRIDLPEEIRLLEYGRRLTDRRRNVLAETGQSTGRRLFTECLSGGEQALQQNTGRIETGARADFVVLDTSDPVLAGRDEDLALDSWIFSGDSRQVSHVYVGGRAVVREGRALCRDAVNRDYAAAMADIMPVIAS